MSFNLLLKRYVEAEVNNNTHVDGKWRVEVVCPNGEVKKPLGEKWRKNLIQDRGLNIFNGTFTSHAGGTGGQSIEGFINSALFGSDSSDPFSSDKTAPTSPNDSLYWSKRLTSNVVENTSPNIDDLNEGSRIFRRAWDFAALSAGETRTVREIMILASSYPGGYTGADQLKGTQYTFGTNLAVISRFILPEPITLTEFQFLRLYYSIKVTVPSIVNPVEISLESSGFDATGQLKLVGLWSSIFSTNGHSWNTRSGYGYLGTQVIRPWTPWALIGRYGCSALIVAGNTDPNLNYNFPDVGENTGITYGQLYDDTQTVTQSLPGGSMNPIGGSVAEILPVNQTLTREASLLFQANNPSVESPLGGIIIMPVGGIENGSQLMTAGSNPVFQPYVIDTDYAAARYFWYWRFTDETFSSPRSVIKDRNYGLAINLRQTMSRG
jgi:hypothetical protein